MTSVIVVNETGKVDLTPPAYYRAALKRLRTREAGK